MEISLKRLNESGTFANEVLFLTQQKSYTFGRNSRNDITLNSKNVSGTHCIFHHNPDGLFVEVLKSKKGLHVNGAEQKIGAMVFLNHGDIIDIGNVFKYQLQFKPLIPHITNENKSSSDFNQPPPDVVEPQPENLSIKVEPQDSNLYETPPQNEMIESEVQNTDFMEFQAGNISIKPEHVEPLLSEKGRGAFEEETMEIPLPFTRTIKSEPDYNPLDSSQSMKLIKSAQDFEFPAEINPERDSVLNHQPMSFSYPQISDLDAAMQISIDEHDSKSLLLPLTNQENSTSVSETFLKEPGNQIPLSAIVKQERQDTPNESTLRNLILESNLNQNVLENRIKIENPDIPATNVTFFAKRTPEIHENFSVESRIPETLPIENFLHQNENLKLPTRIPTPDLDEGMQIEIEEPDTKPFLPSSEIINSVASELPLNLENKENTKISISSSSRPFLRIRNDLRINVKTEPSIQNHFQTIESRISPSIPNQNDLGVEVKEENIDPPSKNQIEVDQNSEIRVKEERVDSPLDPPNKNQIEVDQNSEFRIKEERVDPPLDTPNENQSKADENFEIRVKEERLDLPFDSSNEDQNLGIRIKEERVDPPNENHNEADQSLGMKIKEEIINSCDKSPEVEFVEERRKRKRRGSDEGFPRVRVKQEKIDPLDSTEDQLEPLDQIITRTVKEERLESLVPDLSIQNRTSEVPFNQNLPRVKQEPVSHSSQNERQRSDPIDYSQLVCDDIEFHEEKPIPSSYENRNNLKQTLESLNSTDSDSSDSSSDSSNDDSSSEFKRKRDYKNADIAVKKEVENSKVPEFKSISDIKILTATELAEIFENNKEPEEIEKLLSLVYKKRLAEKKELEKRREGRKDYAEKIRRSLMSYEISEDEIEIITEKKDRKRKKSDRKNEKSSKKESKEMNRGKKESDKNRKNDKKQKGKEKESERTRHDWTRESGSKDRKDSKRESFSDRKESLSEKERMKSRKVNERERRDSREDNKNRRESDSRRESPKRGESSRREISKSRDSPERESDRKEINNFFRRSESPRSDENFQRRTEDNQEFQNDLERFESTPGTSTEDPRTQAKESEVGNRDPRTDPTDRNYPGARVLDDYELPEERGRLTDTRDRAKKDGSKKKLDYKEYMKRRASEKGSQSKDNGARGVEPNVVPISTFRGSRNQAHLMTEGLRDPRVIPRSVGNSGVPVSAFSEFRTQPQGLQADLRFVQRGIDNLVPNSFMDPRFQGRQPPIGDGSSMDPRFLPYYPISSSTYMDPAMQGRPESIGVPRDPRYMYGGVENVPAPTSTFIDPRMQGRVESQSSLGETSSRDPRFIYGGIENAPASALNFMDPRVQRRVESQSLDSGKSLRNHRVLPRVDKPKVADSKTSASGEVLVINPKSKLRLANEKVKKDGKNRKDSKDGKHPTHRGMSEDRLMKKVSRLKVAEEVRTPISTEPLESQDLTDELLMTIFSWNPALFESGDAKDEAPISGLRNIRKTSLSYLNYDAYCFTVFNILLLDVSIQIKEAFDCGGEKVMLEKCRMLPDIVPKVWIKAQNSFLVPFYLKTSVPILEDLAPPAVGDLLRISVLDEKANTSVIFGYIQKIVNEEPTDTPRKLVTYLVVIKQQKFDIYNGIVQNIKPILNLVSSMEKAKAVYGLRESPLLSCILRPNPEIDQLVPKKLLSLDNLIYQKTLDKKQLTAVSKIMESFWSNEPNICVIEGTAGTGKTNIIINTILQLLCTKQPKLERDHLRILVCASTNTELDEIIIKLNSAIDSAKIEKDVVKMVVVGPDDGRRERTKDLSLSHFARHHVECDIHKYQESMGLKSMEEQAIFIEEQMKILEKKFLEKRCVHVALQMSLLNKYYVIGKSGRRVKNMTPVEKKELLDVAESTFLAGANLIFSSIQNLTCTVMENFREKYRIPVCIVDEAAQILEMDTLKVLPFGEKTLVLLGDIYKHPTNYEHTQRLRKLGWGNSLFSRLVDNFMQCQRSPVVNLITQYRITVRIERWLMQSSIFGMNCIRNLAEEKIAFPLHPLRIFNLKHTEDFVDNEAVFASRVIHCIANFGDLRRMERNISVGVIISDIDAKERVEQEIHNKLEEVIPGKTQILNIEVDTIDGFQNHEKDIVLASCIRNKHLISRAGFMRFYYTLTRAKRCLIIYGRFAKVGKFKQPCEWHQLVDYARKIVNVSVYAESTELRRDLIK